MRLSVAEPAHEPDLTAERRDTYTDRLAPLPAVACGWRVPDPIGDFVGYLPFVVLDHFPYSYQHGLVLTAVWLGAIDLFAEREGA